MESGTLFIWLSLSIAPGLALALLWRGGRRALRESHRRQRIAVVTVAALALWVLASYFMLFMVFVTTWDVAHTRPRPDGFFPEGWPIYGCLAAYSLLGATLLWALNVMPPKPSAFRHESQRSATP